MINILICLADIKLNLVLNRKKSCVNNTKTGCSLPRDMRSQVCNDYLCDPLNKLRKLFTHTHLPKGVFFISRAQNNWKKDDLDADNRIVGSVLISRGDLC
jgi:hypothetical protein